MDASTPKDSTTAQDKPSPHEVALGRLNRKLARRDEKIKGLEKRVAQLEAALSSRSLDLSYLRNELHLELAHTVQNALCNVRMIPVFPLGGERKIVEVRVSDEPKKK